MNVNIQLENVAKFYINFQTFFTVTQIRFVKFIIREIAEETQFKKKILPKYRIYLLIICYMQLLIVTLDPTEKEITYFLLACIFKCLLSPPFVQNFSEHSVHWNSFSPRCVVKCLWSEKRKKNSISILKVTPQDWHYLQISWFHKYAFRTVCKSLGFLPSTIQSWILLYDTYDTASRILVQ